MVERAGDRMQNGRVIGLLGELHPEVLEQWQISVPAVSLELELDRLLDEGVTGKSLR
jgi:phenylalanyl-tRNA synthetase beta chain